MKIYSDDPLVHYKNSTINPERTRNEIDGLLAEWQVKDTAWHWDPTHNDIWVGFKLEEKINDAFVYVGVKAICPIVWDRAKPRARPPQPEQVNLRVSMRALWWFLKTHLEMAYVMQSEKIRAFLPYIATSDGKTLADVIMPKLGRISELEALENKVPSYSEEKMRKVIDFHKEAES